MLFTETTTPTFDSARIVVQSLETGERRIVVEGGSFPRYSPTGHVVFARPGTLLAVPFDLARLEATGPPAPVVEGVLWNRFTGAAQFALSRTGSLAYVPGSELAANAVLVWVDRRGGARPLPAPPRPYENPRLSPDGSRVAVDVNDDVWVYDLVRGTLTRLTFEPTENETPVWTPDGKRVTYASDRQGKPRSVFWKPADGSSPEELLLTRENHAHVTSWSPDGRVLAVTDFDPVQGGDGDIWLFPADGKGEARPFLKTPFGERAGRFSPDGRWIAYTSNESGRDEVYVQVLPGPGGKWQVSTDGGGQPVWARSGRELFYRNGDKLMATPVTAQPTFFAGTPRVLFAGRYWQSLPGRGDATYDVSPDGQRFLMIKVEEETASTQLNVVLDWFEELKRRVPAGAGR